MLGGQPKCTCEANQRDNNEERGKHDIAGFEPQHSAGDDDSHHVRPEVLQQLEARGYLLNIHRHVRRGGALK